MFTPRVRLALAIISFLLGCYRIVTGDYLGLVLLAASAFITYGYFKYGTVWLAFRAVARGQMDHAAKLLQQVARPEALRAEDRAYYELASALVCASRAQNERAERHLQSALAHPLRTENDRGLAEAVLAQLLIARDELPEARRVLDQAAGRSCRPGVAERIRTLREELPKTGSS